MTLDSTTTKATLATAMEYLKTRHIGDVTIRDNIEGRYSNLGVSATIPAFESYVFKLDTTVPTVDNSSPSDSDTGVTQSFNTSVNFSEIMDKTTITTNTSDTSCSGTFQFSADNFDTCLKNTGVTFTVSNSDKTFSVRILFATSTTCKFRITSGATDLAGNSVSMTAISFTTN